MPTNPPLMPCRRRPKKQRNEPMREGNDGDAQNEDRPADHHQRLASQPICEQAGKQGGDHASQQHGCDNDRQLAGIESRGSLEVRQCAANDADIHSVEQAAQPSNEEKEAVITAVTWHYGDRAKWIELQTTRITCGPELLGATYRKPDFAGV